MRISLLLIFLVVLSATVYATDFSAELSQPEYAPKEAVWVRLNFGVDLEKDLVSSDVFLYLNTDKVSITKKLDKVDDYNYYFSFILPSIASKNYSVKIENVKYLKDKKLNIATFTVPFEVTKRDPVVKIWPPVWIDTFDNAFHPKTTFEIRNEGSNITNLEIDDEGELVPTIMPISLSLNPGHTMWITAFSNITNFNKNYQYTDLVFAYANTTYTVPVIFKFKFTTAAFDVPIYIPVESNISVTENVSLVNETNVTNLANATNVTESIATSNPSLMFTYPFENVISSKIIVNSDIVVIPPIFKNTGNVDLHNITDSFTGKLGEFMETDFIGIDTFPVGESATLTVKVYANKSSLGNYVGNLVLVSSEGVNATLEFNLTFVNETIATSNTSWSGTQTLYQENTSAIVTEDLESKSNYIGWIIVIIVVIIIALVAFTLYKKGKNKQKKFEQYVDSISRK